MSSNLSIFTPGQQTIRVTDCGRGECPPPAEFAKILGSTLFQEDQGAPSLSGTTLSPRIFREINANIPASVDTTYQVSYSQPDLIANFGAFYRTDIRAYYGYTTGTLTSNATAGNYTTIPGCVINQDSTLTGAPAGCRMRPLGYYISIQFPTGVGRVRLSANTVATTAARNALYIINDDQASCISFFVPFRDSINLYGGNLTSPSNPDAYRFIHPGPYGSGVLPSGVGAQELPGVILEDLNFTQAAFAFTYSAWALGYNEDTLNAFITGSMGQPVGPLSGDNM